ncbi:MAG: YfcE family phosphodiesterase [Lachnospiraceae bacterium]|jgi:putative phosphoesterase|nr:YfcE family phosphodiesterase [Lachnospiraceae bacterium]
MKVLIVSDTHRHNENFFTVMEKVGPVDLVVHCGDVEGAEAIIMEKAGCPVEMVQGNNDFWSAMPREKEFSIGKHKVFLTHGHNYYVSMNYEIIKQEAIAREAGIVMCGHTHKPVIDIGGEVTVINPGSLSYPRQEGRKPSYIIMEIDRNGEPHYTLNYVE